MKKPMTCDDEMIGQPDVKLKNARRRQSLQIAIQAYDDAVKLAFINLSKAPAHINLYGTKTGCRRINPYEE